MRSLDQCKSAARSREVDFLYGNERYRYAELIDDLYENLREELVRYRVLCICDKMVISWLKSATDGRLLDSLCYVRYI